MLPITIPAVEYFDDKTQTFIYTKPQTLQLEHSLVSLYKWESKWKKPFLKKDYKMTREESIDYIRCMTITQNVDPLVYNSITNDIIDQVSAYIEDSMTATWFKEEKNRKPNREIITAEVIYYWMIKIGIPFKCEKWHLNKLLTLIRVCSAKDAPAKKTNNREWASERRAINAARKKSLHTKG